MSYTSEFNIWNKMIGRCERPADKNYPDYGGRGIRICPRWRSAFRNFFADMGPRPSRKHSVERLDVNGDYCPENCVWATNKVQSRNKRNNHIVPFQSRLMTLAEASELSGIGYQNAKSRLSRGWSFERTFSEPVQDSAPPRTFPLMKVGMRFGRLLAIEVAEPDKEKRLRWRFRCDCGKEIVTLTKLVWREHTTSCGCRAKERIIALNRSRALRG